ncbi:abortive infection system antitoxin AbiGi family protein [Vibrio parahaemolyticus]|uniref:abortive infection system antitoxin AbiGi family protein n=1 Tax=Vibrio parahaemolyticus TaxID=670 RepID=UPI0015DD7E57|nr:abortive infection system antitoxin AbiGi family protein [Vibrio parahaemolyticus]
MNPKSHTLFHFTKNKDTLLKILKGGFWPRYCLEDISWQGYDGQDFVAHPMVCFCDIPLSRIDEHVDFYGMYGVGVTKEWAEINKITPVQYISNNNHLKKTFQDLINVSSNLNKEEAKQFLHNFRYLLAHIKPTQGRMLVDGLSVDKEFYQESEWRCVPKHPEKLDHLTKEMFDSYETLSNANKVTFDNCRLKITPNDIKYIFVKEDSDIPEVINFIQSDLDEYSASQVKILMSRVISLESIKKDI